MSEHHACNSICWFDVPVLDIDRAMKFYSKVLLMDLTKESWNGLEMSVLPHHDHAIGGCLFKGGDEKPSSTGVMVYFDVDGRLDDAQAEVEKNNGKVLQPKHQIGQHGFRAVVLDSEGNRIALHSRT